MRLDVDTAQITTEGKNTFKSTGASSVCVIMTGTMQKECSDQHHRPSALSPVKTDVLQKEK